MSLRGAEAATLSEVEGVAGGDEAISGSSYERLLRRPFATLRASARNDRIVEYFSGRKSK